MEKFVLLIKIIMGVCNLTIMKLTEACKYGDIGNTVFTPSYNILISILINERHRHKHKHICMSKRIFYVTK